MEFLVNIKFDFPPDVSDARRTELLKAEAERAKELADEGKLMRMWRVPGRRENFGLWRAGNATELHAALVSLPLFPFLDIAVVPLATHHADPQQVDGHS